MLYIYYDEINGLIGFYLDKGYYDINIKYIAPGLKIGKCLSGLGLILFIGVVFIERRVKSED